MSKKIMLVLSVMLSVFVFYSMGNEYCFYTPSPHTFSDFLEHYVNIPQKYLYNGLIYGLPIIYVAAVPFINPEIRTRIKRNIFKYIIGKSTVSAIGIGLYVILLSVICAICFEIPLNFDTSMVFVVIRLFVVYFHCNLLFYLAYTLFENPVIAIVVVLGINLIFNTILLAYNFILSPLNNNILLLYDMGILTCIIIAFICLYCILKRKECIK